MAGPTVDRVRFRVGYATTAEVKISVVTFNNDNAVTVVCSGGTTPVVATRVGQGVGSTLCHTGIVTIGGLAADKEYTVAITQAAVTTTGSFKTAPAAGNWKMISGSCAKHNPKNVGSTWKVLREYIQTNKPTAYAHIDDLGYFDTLRVSNFSAVGSSDPETSITQSGVPQVTESKDDYIVAWMAWYGMFPEWFTYPGRDDWEWCMQNVAHWDQFGDHEYYGDARSHVQQLNDQAAMGDNPTINAFAGDLWEVFAGNAGPPRLRAGTKYWGHRVAGVAFASPDFINHAQAYDACNSGDSGPRGATDSAWYIADVSDSGTGANTWQSVYGKAAPSFPTNPSRTTLSVGTDVTGPDYLGSQQVTDLVTYFTSTESSAAVKVLLSAKRITAHNQPWYDFHPEEFVSYISQILSSDSCNGTNGNYFHYAGDVHSFAVTKYQANGSTGLGLTGLTGGELLTEFLCGTINSSSIGSLNRELAQGGSMEFHLDQAQTASNAVPQVDYAAFMEMSFTDADVTVSYINLPTNTTMAGPYELRYTNGSNNFILRNETMSGYIGLDPATIVGTGTRVSSFQDVRSTGQGLIYLADGTETVTLLGARTQGAGGGAVTGLLDIGLYEAVDDATRGWMPATLVAETRLVTPNNAGAIGDLQQIPEDGNYKLEAGKSYMLACVSQSSGVNSNTVAVSTTGAGANFRDNITADSGLPTTFVRTDQATENLALWGFYIKGTLPLPKLDTPFTTIALTTGVAMTSLDLVGGGNISGAVSYSIVDKGLVGGVNWSDPTAIVGTPSGGPGTYTVWIAATNGAGTSYFPVLVNIAYSKKVKGTIIVAGPTQASFVVPIGIPAGAVFNFTMINAAAADTVVFTEMDARTEDQLGSFIAIADAQDPVDTSAMIMDATNNTRAIAGPRNLLLVCNGSTNSITVQLTKSG